MAAPQDQTDGDPIHGEHGRMIQDLIQQQAETEEAFSYQMRDMQKQIISLRKQRTDDAERYEDEISSLRKQVAASNLRSEEWQGRAQQLTKDVRTAATDAATDVLDQHKKTAEKMPNLRSSKLEEKIRQVEKASADLKRDMTAQQDDMDVKFESFGSRLCKLKDELHGINQDTIAKAVAESDLKGRSVVKMRGRLDEVEGHAKSTDKSFASLTKRLEILEGDVNRCKTTSYYSNEATKPHVERKSK